VGSVLAQAYPTGSCAWPTTPPGGRRPWPPWSRWSERDKRVKVARLEASARGSPRHQRRPGPWPPATMSGFLDHDDILKPHALAQVVRWLNADPTLDLLYSDEDKLTTAGRLTEARWKPDWSPNLLLSQNYVCHLLVVRRSLVESALGGLRPDYDGSQDYDLVLRVADETTGSPTYPTASTAGACTRSRPPPAGDNKPFAWLAAQRALGDWLRRRRGPRANGRWVVRGGGMVRRPPGPVPAPGRTQGEHHHPYPQRSPPAGPVRRERHQPQRLRQLRAGRGGQPERRAPRHWSTSPPCPDGSCATPTSSTTRASSTWPRPRWTATSSCS
jgi:hypothetical protein